MKVHQDFFMYQSGIYRYTGLGEARQVGYHSVRIVGWGEDSYRQTSSKYWVTTIPAIKHISINSKLLKGAKI